MSRSVAVKAVAGVATMAGLAVFGVALSSFHEQDEPAPEATRNGPGDVRPWDRPVALPPGLIGLRVTLGLGDREPTEWDGTVAVSEGRVLDVELEHAGPNARVTGPRFSARSKSAGAETKKKNAEKRKKKQQQKQKQQTKKKQQQAGVAPALLVNLDAPPTATVTVESAQGRFEVALRDLEGGRRTVLDGRVAVERQDAAVRLTGRGTEDDYPTLARAPDGSAWLAYVEYQPERPHLAGQPTAEEFDRVLIPTTHGDRIRLAHFDGRSWQPPVDVTDGRLDVWRPTVAVDGQGGVCVAWAQQVDGNWDIYRRRYTPAAEGRGAGRWFDIVRVTDAPGSDFHVVAATDTKGMVWLAWQAYRAGNFDILAAAAADDHPGSRPLPVSEGRANDWSPAIAADHKGNVYVAWDTYDRGNYDVRLRRLGAGSRTWDVARSARFEARASLACDAEDRLWIAYEEGDEQWGKDYSTGEFRKIGHERNPGFALYIDRTVRVKCLEDDTIKAPAGALDSAFGTLADRNKSLPRLAVDAAGGVWLVLRHHPLPGGAGEAWVSSHLRYDGQTWSAPRVLPHSSNLMENRPALAAVAGGILAVYSSDTRTNTAGRDQDDLFAAILTTPQGAGPPRLVADPPAPEPRLEPVHADEPADIARMRDYRMEIGGKTLRLLRGEFHRHTEISAHRDGDGLLEDSWRYSLDAAGLDWMGNGDHLNGFGHEYMWWYVQKVTDLFHNAPRFVAAQTYERSAVYPNGHRNVMFPRRGIRPLPFGVLAGTPEEGSPDTKVLYAYLKHFGGLCASHTSATNMGTDWRDNDPEVEPVVEIYQGHRHNYEHPGAPRAPTAETQIGGYQPAGFIWNALEKGYKLGFQSSSDHISTHWSYAVVLTDDVSRRGIVDAFKKRHSYAATDNIILDVRSGAHLMGDAFETTERPSLRIVAQGPTPIARVHVIRDNAYVLSTEPNRRSVALTYTDDDAALTPGTHYYYVRVQQADGNLAWASPMWITYKP
ncbi:MAG TPA: hypothetical protein VF590_23270 [Isosphaeraceae bacterium]